MRSVFGPRRHAARRLLPVVVTFLALIATDLHAASVAGRVVDPHQQPVADARVVVSGPLGTVATAATDGRGAFAIDALAPGSYVLRVIASGLQADPIAIDLAKETTRTVDVALRISAISESVVVSAAQVDVPLSTAPDSVTVVSRDELEARQIETVPDALRTVPGLAVNRSGSRGAITSIFPRGGNSNYTLVLVDGMRANSFGGGYDFAHLAVDDVARIEVVRGPQSALFGSDAIGGVVNIVTRRGGPTRGDALVEGGSESTMRAAANAAGSIRQWTWGAGVERTRSDGFTGIAPASGERVSNDDDRLTHASGSVGWQHSGGADLLVTGNLARDERGFPGPFGSDPLGVFPGVDRVSRGVNNRRQIGGRFTHPWSARVHQRLEANYTDIASNFASTFGPSTSGTRRFDARVQEDAALNAAVGASFGVEVIHERGDSTYVTGLTGDPLPIRRNVAGSFAEIRYVAGERLFVTSGIRVEHIARDSVEADPFSSRPFFPDQSDTSVNPKIAASYVLRAGTSPTRVHGSAGTGIRPPDVFEIAFTDNPNLKPERSRSLDAGVEQQLGGGALSIGATAFLNRYDDLIVTVGRVLRDASHYQTDNISNARARGLELTADARFGARLTVAGAYTFLDSEILSVDGLGRVAPPPFVVGDPLIRRPRHVASLDATYAAGRLTAFGELTTRSRTLDLEPNFGPSGGLFFSTGYVVGNLGATVRLARAVDIYGRVLNVADRRYEETLGFPALRRSAIVGVRVAAGR